MGTNRTTLRRTLGDRLGDMGLLEATHTSADVSTFRDVVRLANRGDNAPSLTNKILYFSGGTSANLGHEARVTGFVGDTRILSFEPAAPVTPQKGDAVELWNTTERIGSISTLHRLINVAIANVADQVGEETWNTATTFNARSPHLTIPDTWGEVGGATWIDSLGYYHDIPAEAKTVQPGNRRVVLHGRPSWRADRRQIQLWGYPRALPLEDDTTETEVDPEWLVESLLSWFAIRTSANASDVRGPAEERRGQFWATQTALYRRNVGAARRGWGIRMP